GGGVGAARGPSSEQPATLLLEVTFHEVTMSSPRRRRWMDVLRRTAGAASSAVPAQGGLDDADLWASRDDAARAAEEGFRAAERLEATSARERARAEAASERATLLAARAEAITMLARRVEDAF